MTKRHVHVCTACSVVEVDAKRLNLSELVGTVGRECFEGRMKDCSLGFQSSVTVEQHCGHFETERFVDPHPGREAGLPHGRDSIPLELTEHSVTLVAAHLERLVFELCVDHLRACCSAERHLAETHMIVEAGQYQADALENRKSSDHACFGQAQKRRIGAEWRQRLDDPL